MSLLTHLCHEPPNITCVLFGRRFPTISTPNSWCSAVHDVFFIDITGFYTKKFLLSERHLISCPSPEDVGALAWPLILWLEDLGPHTGSNPSKDPWGIVRVGRITYPIQSPALLQSMIFRLSHLVGNVIVRWKSFNTAFFLGGAGCISHDGSMGLCHMYLLTNWP